MYDILVYNSKIYPVYSGLGAESVTQRMLDIFLQAMVVGGKLSLLLMALVFPTLIFADVRRVFTAILSSCCGINPSSYLPITLAASYAFIVWPLHVYQTAYKWIHWGTITLPMAYFIQIGISRLKCPFTPSAVLAYRSIFIFVTLFNNVVSLQLISIKFALVAISCTGFTLCLIHGISSLSASLLTLSVLLFVFLNIFMYLTGRIYESSQDCLHNWKREKRGSTLNYKTLNSLQTFRINVGSQYYVDRGVLPKLNSAILENVVATALTLR